MSYQSPCTNRYGSAEMRALWSEDTKRRAWRRVWVAVAEAQAAAGLVTAQQVDDIRANSTRIDVGRAAEIEAEIGHDLMAELQVFAEQCKVGGGGLPQPTLRTMPMSCGRGRPWTSFFPGCGNCC